MSIAGSQEADRITGGRSADIFAGGAGNDRIMAGSGGSSIEGGIGSDKLFGGDGANTFHFAASSGRDNFYQFTVGRDRIDVSAFVESYDDIRVTDIHNGPSPLITFASDLDPAHRIIVHDVLAASLNDTSFLVSS